MAPVLARPGPLPFDNWPLAVRLGWHRIGVLEAGYGGHVIVGFTISPDNNPEGIAAGDPYILQSHPHYLGFGRDNEYFLPLSVGYDPGGRYRPGLVRNSEGPNPLASP